jgi:hypothetical protein
VRRLYLFGSNLAKDMSALENVLRVGDAGIEPATSAA